MRCCCYREYKNNTLIICNCIDCQMVNKYITNDIMNKNLCFRCDSEYNFISYLKYTNQLSYDNIIEKRIRYSKLHDLFSELIEDNYDFDDPDTYDYKCNFDRTRLNSYIKLRKNLK